MKWIYHVHKKCNTQFYTIFNISVSKKKEVFSLKRHRSTWSAGALKLTVQVLFPDTMVAMVHWLSRYLKAPRRSTEAVMVNISSYWAQHSGKVSKKT